MLNFEVRPPAPPARTRKIVFLNLAFAAAICCYNPPLVRAQAPATKATAPAAIGRTTVVDRLQVQLAGDVRTVPKLPRAGVWGLLIGQPPSSAEGAGIQIDAAGQAILYPTTELLSATAGTIEFSVVPTGDVPADANRVLLDSWAISGAQRFLVSLQGSKLTLAYTDNANATKTIETNVNWRPKTPHRITILWNAADLSLLVDGALAGKIDQPAPSPREPLGLVLGNNRDFQAPARLSISDLRLSTAREAQGTPDAGSDEQIVPNDEMTLKMAQSYQRGLYPLLEQLRRQNVVEVDFAYALAQADVGDFNRALQTVAPIVANGAHPLYVPAIFLRADMLSRQNDFNGAYEQLQILAGSKDADTAVRAQVRQAAVLFDQGNKAESLRLLGEIIAKYTDLPAINEAYLMIGLDRFRSGDFQNAYEALRNMGVPGSPPRMTVAVGGVLEIKVADPDLNVRLTEVGLPVVVTSDGGDKESLTLRAAFSKGVYLGSLATRLGEVKQGDGILQLAGGDKVHITYTDRVSGEAANQQRVVNIGVATDARITVLAQSALDIYQEAKSYQAKSILGDSWEVVGVLPQSASSFFRNAEDGTLRRKGWRFDRSFLTNIKPGQSLYVELNEPDADTTKGADTIKVDVSLQNGKSIPVTLTETGSHTGVFAATVKTALAGKGGANTLEVATNDTLTALYKDPTPAQGTLDPVRLASIAIRPAEGTLAVGLQVPTESTPVFMRVSRISGNNTTATIMVEDRDMDAGDAADKVTVQMTAESGATAPVTLTETGTHTGVFTGSIKISSDEAATGAGVLKVKSGERLTARYVDEENASGRPATREYLLRANIAENAKVTFLRQVVEKIIVPKGVNPASLPLPKVTWVESSVLVPGNPYRAVVSDPDVLPTRPGVFGTKITLKGTSGAAVDVPLAAAVQGPNNDAVFIGEFFVRLGDESSPSRAFYSQTGVVVDIDEEKAGGLWSQPALNVQGKDTVAATYLEPLTSDSKRNVARAQSLRVSADGETRILNVQGNELEVLKPGMPFELQVADADGDITDKRDGLKVFVTSSGGDKMTLDLVETDPHSGIFSTRVKTMPGTAPASLNAAGNAIKTIGVPFEGKVTIAYRDEEAVDGANTVRETTLRTRPLGDAAGVLLTKVYEDPKFELETLIRLGESLYAVGAADLATTKKEEGKGRTNPNLQDSARILQQIVDRFPTSDYVTESLFLTGKIRREEQKTDEAKKLFTRVIEEYPESDFVPQALYQLVLLHYAQNDIENTTETAMRLVYGFPKNPLVADAFLRIAEFYYGKKEYTTAAYVYKRLIEKFPDNPKADLVAYRMATALYRAGLGGDKSAADKPELEKAAAEKLALANAVRYYLEFSENFKDHELADDALYWAANAMIKQEQTKRAYTLLTRQLVTYASGDMKSYATKLRDKLKEETPTIDAD